MTISRTAFAVFCCALSAYSLPFDAQAEDRLIWQPTKSGENGMRLRMGLKLPVDGAASAGADVSVAATRSGRVEGMPVDVWVHVASRRGAGKAVVSSRTVDGVYDPRSGIGILDIGTARKRIVNASVDLEQSRGIAISCNAYASRCDDVALRQSARMTAVATGTALVAEGHYSSATLDISNVLRVEQEVTRKMNVSAALASPFRDGRQASINLSYGFRW